MAKNDEQVIGEFNEAVNMSRKEIENFLQTDESKEVGQKDGGGESKGHESDLTDDDIDHMRRVVSYVHRHGAQGPKKDVEDSNWRYSLMRDVVDCGPGTDTVNRMPGTGAADVYRNCERTVE